MIITIDGPAGTGKSTVAKALAQKLHYGYFDTGAMYRSLTFFLQREKVDLDNEKAIQEALSRFQYDIREDNDHLRYFVNEEEVTEEIRLAKVSQVVSKVAAYPAVREYLIPFQQEFAKKRKNLVVEGRDIGSVIFPNAEIKFFLTATLEIRAKRRLDQLKREYPLKFESTSLEQQIQEIKLRDETDLRRKSSPLRCPDNAYMIDTSNLDIEEVLRQMFEKIPSIPNHFFPPVYKMKFFYGFVLSLAWIFFKLFYRIKVYGIEHFPRGKAILAANHLSYLDPEVIAISSKEEIHFLAKKSLFHQFFLGWLIKKLNTHPITGEKGDVSTIKLVYKLLQENKKVLLFPEGKRSETGKLGEIMPGISFLSYMSSACIVPIYIRGTEKIWHVNSKFPKLCGKIYIVFGRPISVDSKNKDKKKVMAEITERLSLAFAKLEDWVDLGKRGSPP